MRHDLQMTEKRSHDRPIEKRDLVPPSGDFVAPHGGFVPPNSIAAVASDFGVTPRALRFYESRGLLAPQRDGAVRHYSA